MVRSLCPFENIHRRLPKIVDASERREAKTQRNCMGDVNSQCFCFFQGSPRHTAHEALQFYYTHFYTRDNIPNMDLL
jgi:hypothetical protein